MAILHLGHMFYTFKKNSINQDNTVILAIKIDNETWQVMYTITKFLTKPSMTFSREPNVLLTDGARTAR